MTNGNFVKISIPIDGWFSHPTDKSIDVAIVECGIPTDADHVVIPFSICATASVFSEHEVSLGDEVFVSGLFHRYFGNKRNIPIVRVGHLAALGEEKISTEKFGDIDGYLVEARSTGGLSGSPVFLNLGVVRMINGEVKHSQKKDTVFFLLGLIHGHFLAKSGDGVEDVNAGIAIVVSIASIRVVIGEYEKNKPVS